MKVTPKRWIKEYRAGRENGLKHNQFDPLCRANISKMEEGIRNGSPLVQAYWKGYKNGMNFQEILK